MTTTTVEEGMSTRSLARHLDVTYRQLDYVARLHSRGGDLAGAQGSGSRRVWSPDLIVRLELAALLARTSGRPWSQMAGTMLDADEPPAAGWVMLDDLGGVHYAADTAGLAVLLARGDGGIVARYV